MMSCQQATRLMSDAQDTRLSLKDRAELKLHLMMCTGCRNFGKQLGFLHEIAQAYAKEADSDDQASHTTKGS